LTLEAPFGYSNFKRRIKVGSSFIGLASHKDYHKFKESNFSVDGQKQIVEIEVDSCGGK
jgi:hypothetical protein